MSERKFTLVREFNGKSELVRGFDSRSELDYWAVEKHDLVKVEGGYLKILLRVAQTQPLAFRGNNWIGIGVRCLP